MACTKCKKSKCCCKTKVISKLGTKGNTGATGPKGNTGNTGEAYVPYVAYKKRTTFQNLGNGDPVSAYDVDLEFLNLDAGTYLVNFEANLYLSRNTPIVAEEGYLTVDINGDQRNHFLKNITSSLSPTIHEIKAAHALTVTVLQGGAIQVRYIMTAFTLNPSTSIGIGTGGMTIMKVS